jgi:peroxiredoxin
VYLLNKDFVTPIHKVPNLNLELINDTQLELHKQYPEKYTLLIFYRGYHCPKCKQQLEEFKVKLEEFTERGINLLGISMDTEKTRQKNER